MLFYRLSTFKDFSLKEGVSPLAWWLMSVNPAEKHYCEVEGSWGCRVSSGPDCAVQCGVKARRKTKRSREVRQR